MSFKSKSKSNLKYISAIAMSLFSLVALFVGTAAWFMSCRQEQGATQEMPVEAIYGKFKKVTFHLLDHKHLGLTDAETEFFFDKTAIGTISKDWDTGDLTSTGNTSIQLNQYQQLNQEQPLLLLFELTSEYDTSTDGLVTIKASIDNDKTTGFLGEKKPISEGSSILVPKYTLGVPQSGDESLLLKRENNKDYYPLSSVVKFYTKQFSSDEFDTLNEETTFNFVIGNTNSPGNFVTINSADETSTFNPSITLYQSSANTKVEYIAIIIDYYPEAIESIYTTYLANPYLENLDYILYYICDWTMEVE